MASEAATTSGGGRRGVVVAFLAAVAVALACAAVTGNVWEDYLIALRHARNLTTGHGLTYNPGERVQGFSSPIGVLVPSLALLLSGGSEDATLWIWRLACAMALGLGVALLVRVARLPAPGVDALAGGLAAALVLTDFKTVVFAANGMETAFVVLGVAGTLAACTGALRGWGWLAASWACLQFARADGFVYGLAVAAAALIVAPIPRRELVRIGSRAAAASFLAYAPWLVFTWFYYGSPVPETVVAKWHYMPGSTIHGVDLVKTVGEWLIELLSQTFEPVYPRLAGWPPWVEAAAFAAGAFTLVLALRPSSDRVGRTAAVAYVLAATYLAFVGATAVVFPWYVPAAAVLALVALARGPSVLLHGRLPERFALLASRGVLAIGLAVALTVSVMATVQIRVQQREIETGTRRVIGEWLRDRVAPGDVVYVEATGYVGYYCDCRIEDWPGLVSPRVVAIRREHGTDMFTTIPYLEPDWIVLRPHEARGAFANADVARHYEHVQTFDARQRLAAYEGMAGAGYLGLDAAWLVFRRVDAGDASGR